MKTQTLIRVSEMFLLAVAVSLVVLVAVYAVQNLHSALKLASVSWNG